MSSVCNNCVYHNPVVYSGGGAYRMTLEKELPEIGETRIAWNCWASTKPDKYARVRNSCEYKWDGKDDEDEVAR